MEDTYLKIGILLVAVTVMALLIGFAFHALNQPSEPEEKIQSFTGSAKQLEYKISKLCGQCASASDQECYLIKAEITEGNLSSTGNPEFVNFVTLPPGNYFLRVESSGSKCVIRRME